MRNLTVATILAVTGSACTDNSRHDLPPPPPVTTCQLGLYRYSPGTVLPEDSLMAGYVCSQTPNGYEFLPPTPAKDCLLIDPTGHRITVENGSSVNGQLCLDGTFFH